MGKMKNIGVKVLALFMLSGAGTYAPGCASGRGESKGGWIGTEIVENVNIKRTKINVGTARGENIQMVLVEEPGGGKWIEDNGGNIVYRWDPSSRGWRPTSNPSIALNLSITPYVDEEPEVDEFSIPTSKEKTATVVYGSTIYENARVVEVDSKTAVIYDKDGVKIFEKVNGQWYKITSYGIAVPIEGLNISIEIR
ncbi:MAG: hypothetical protein QXG02_00565 [Candidatus Anstonellales archaeon]